MYVIVDSDGSWFFSDNDLKESDQTSFSLDPSEDQLKNSKNYKVNDAENALIENLDGIKETKKREIRAFQQEKINEIKLGIPEDEQKLYIKKATAGTNHSAGSASDLENHIIDDERHFTDETKDALVAKIASNEIKYSRAFACLTGFRRGCEKNIDIAETKSAINSAVSTQKTKLTIKLNSILG